MTEDASSADHSEVGEVQSARAEFHDALLRSHTSRNGTSALEAAAARFCQALRRQGVSPERMLVFAKQVIHEAIDGDDAPVAETAVTSCIEHYFK